MADLSSFNEMVYVIGHIEGDKITHCEDIKYYSTYFPADYTMVDVRRLKDNPCNCELGFVLIPFYSYEVVNNEECDERIVEI